MAKHKAFPDDLACSVCGLFNSLIREWNRLNPGFRMAYRWLRCCPGCSRYACQRCSSWEGGHFRCRHCIRFAVAREIELQLTQELLFRGENSQENKDAAGAG